MIETDSNDLIGLLNEGIAEQLRDMALLRDPVVVPVLTEQTGDFAKTLEMSIKKAGGMSIVLASPTWRIGDTDKELIVSVVVLVTENPIINNGPSGTHKPCSYFALQIYLSMLGFAVDGWSKLESPGDGAAVRLKSLQPLVTYEIVFQARTFVVLDPAES